MTTNNVATKKRRAWTTTVFVKQLMAFSGLFFVFFLLFHAYGNLKMFLGQEAYDSYAHWLHEDAFYPIFPHGGFLLVFRVVMVVLILVHILAALDVWVRSKKARKMLDEAGWTECKISVSNSLDEYLIQDMLLQGAQIDLFGVGERMITAKSEPVFGGVYKLVAIEEPDGTVIPKIKVSENVEKITIPHFKKVYRLYGRDTGKAIADYLTVYDETVDDSQNLEIFDPDATWKRKEVYHFEARELLVPIFRGGRLVYQKPALDDIRAYCAQQLTTLWPEVLRFDYPHNYYVDLSEKLLKIKLELLNAGGKSQG